MKATQVKKTYQLTIEATEDELRDLMFQLEQCAGYGADAELRQILVSMIGEEEEDE